MKKLAEQYGDLAAPGIFLIFSLTLTPWLYNFPLNDDWAYAIGVKNLLEQGRFALCGWAAATQLAHISAGAFFAAIFGFSFLTLKAYTLTAAAGTVFIFSKTLEEFDVAPVDRTLAALALALNPLFLILANSFMTDITYMFWMVLSSYLYIRHLRHGGAATLLCASLFAAAAFLTRQLGIAIPLAYTLALALERRLDIKTALNAWLFPLAAMAGYMIWFKYFHGPTWASENYVLSATLEYISHPAAFASAAFYRFICSIIETGFLLFPPAAGYLFLIMPGIGASAAVKVKRPDKNSGRKNRADVARNPDFGVQNQTAARTAWFVIAALAVFALINGPLPYLENTFSGSGLGVLTVGGSQFKPSAFFASAIFWHAITALSVLSAGILAGLSRPALKTSDAPVKFVFAAAMLHMGISLIGSKFFDRYLLTWLPWFILAAALAAKKIRFSRPAAVLALVFMAALGWTGVKDYMQWNRAKWELAAKPRPDLKPEEIAGGFDHDAWFNYEKNMAYLKSFKPLKMIEEWEWQKVTDYKAMTSFNPQTGLTTIDKIEYATPLYPGKGQIYLLNLPKRKP